MLEPMKRHRTLSFGLIGAILALALTACNSFTTLQAIVIAVEHAVAILNAAGVGVPAQAVTYVTAVASCISQDNNGNPTAEQVAQITACLAGQVAPTLAPGTEQSVLNIVAILAQDVAAYLADHPLDKMKGKTFSAADGARLKQFQDRARAARNKLIRR